MGEALEASRPYHAPALKPSKLFHRRTREGCEAWQDRKCGIIRQVVLRIALGSTQKLTRCTYPPTPGIILHEYQNKGLTEKAFRNSLILKGHVLGCVRRAKPTTQPKE